MPFEFRNLELPGPLLIRPQVFDDGRGFFLELYKHSEFASAGITEHLVQDNYSKSVTRGAPGTAFSKKSESTGQAGHVHERQDLRRCRGHPQGSPQYGKWVGAELT